MRPSGAGHEQSPRGAFASLPVRSSRLRAPESLIAELETAVSGSSKDKRRKTLERVTELFVENAEHFSDDHVDVFDDVLLYLIKRVETQATTELGQRLAPVENAPYQVIQHLARHDDIEVAAPVLAESNQLAAHDLTEIAETKSEEHVAAIAKRAHLEQQVTDVLVERGDRDTVHALVSNVNAAFSDNGFQKLVQRAEKDAALSEQVGMRLDLPSKHLRQLLDKATAEVQSRVMAFVPLEARDEIQRIVNTLASDAATGGLSTPNLVAAQQFIDHLKEKNEFSESSILEFAKMGKYDELIVGLADLCSASLTVVHRVMQSTRREGLLILCKASGLQWLTVGAILSNRFSEHAVAVEELRKAKLEYNKLSVAAAQKILRFFLLRASPKAAQRKAKQAAKQPAQNAAKGAPQQAAKPGKLEKVPLRHAR
jgi:uncharacterized protein (DUF2336 family)